jgi:hypothetical protein
VLGQLQDASPTPGSSKKGALVLQLSTLQVIMQRIVALVTVAFHADEGLDLLHYYTHRLAYATPRRIYAGEFAEE